MKTVPAQVRRRRAPLRTVCVIGPDGWMVAERPVDFAAAMVVESVADELRALVRSDSGWTPTIVMLDQRGRDVTQHYSVN